MRSRIGVESPHENYWVEKVPGSEPSGLLRGPATGDPPTGTAVALAILSAVGSGPAQVALRDSGRTGEAAGAQPAHFRLGPQDVGQAGRPCGAALLPPGGQAPHSQRHTVPRGSEASG